MQTWQPKRTTVAVAGPCSGEKFFLIITLILWMAGAKLSSAGSPQQNAAKSWRLATGDTEIELVVNDGSPVMEGLRSTATHRNWLASPLKESLMKSVQVDGVAKDLDWKFEGADPDATGEQLTLHFSNASPKLNLDSVWRVRSGHGPAEHWVTIANQSGRTITVTQQESLALTNLLVPVGESAQAWWINRGASNATREGMTFQGAVNADFDQVLESNNHIESSPVPWMAIQIRQDEGLYVGWEFSGIGDVRARTTSTDPTRFELHVGLVPDFKTDIPAGETFLAPPAFVGCYKGDIDDGSYTLHRFILEKLLPSLPPNQPYPTLAYNLYLDVGGDKARESDVLNSAAFCKRLGFETFVPDAMWAPKLGEWISAVPGKVTGSRWGVLNALFPTELLSPSDPLIEGTLQYIEGKRNMGPGGLPLHLGSMEDIIWVAVDVDNVAEAHLVRNEGDAAIQLLYAALNHGTPLYTWCEQRGEEPGSTRKGGDLQHLWTPVAVVRFLRDALVMEEDNRLHLARGIERSWLASGQEVGIKDASTHFGALTYHFSIDPAKTKLTGVIEFPVSKIPYMAILHCRMPEGLRVVSVDKGSQATVAGDGAALKWSHPRGTVHFEAQVSSGN